MKLRSGHHLTYCTNIHAGETWPEVFASLNEYLPQIKAIVSPDHPFGVGLRLSNVASEELLRGDALERFAGWLSGHGLYVFTLNGFPYGSFHGTVVKDEVYRPDWTAEERVEYTKRLCTILARLLPPGVEGGISTSPLSYTPWFAGHPVGREQAFAASTTNLLRIAEYCAEFYRGAGKLLHLDIEPEPDCFLETSSDFVTYYTERLLPAARAYFQQTPNAGAAEGADIIVKRHIRLCYDVCHLAVEYEDPATVFDRMEAAGIRIGKIQISAALKVLLGAERETHAQHLQPFAESTYLHQSVVRDRAGAVHRFSDLDRAIPLLGSDEFSEVRTHFHVPVFLAQYGGLQSTQNEIVAVFNELQRRRLAVHLEVETYTWDVLPPAQRIPLRESIVRELQWVLGYMQ